MDELTEQTLVHAVALERVAAGQQKAVLDELRVLELSVAEKLSRAETLTDPQTKKYGNLLRATDRTINSSYAKIVDQSTRDLNQLQEVEVQEVARQLNGKITVDVLDPSVTEKLAEAVVKPPVNFGREVADWWTAQGEDYKQRFDGEIRQGILLGETVDQMVRRVRGTRAQGFTDGIAEIKRRQATALVRTSVISVTNQAKLDTLAELPMVKSVRWLATLDNRVSKVCRALDGLEWRLPDYKPIGHNKRFPGPTAHHGCRSTQLPVMRSWKELGATRVPVLPKSKVDKQIEANLKQQGRSPEFIEDAKRQARASIDGPTEAATFEEWLDTKDDDFKRDLLGRGRFELWNSGAITLKQLTDQQNRPLTVEQLREVSTGERLSPPETAAGFIPVDQDKLNQFSSEIEVLQDQAAANLEELAKSNDEQIVEALKATEGETDPIKRLELVIKKIVELGG